jgi:hypothetical protein
MYRFGLGLKPIVPHGLRDLRLLVPGPRSEPSNANSPRVVPGLHALFGPFKELSRRNCAGQE